MSGILRKSFYKKVRYHAGIVRKNTPHIEHFYVGLGVLIQKGNSSCVEIEFKLTN